MIHSMLKSPMADITYRVKLLLLVLITVTIPRLASAQSEWEAMTQAIKKGDYPKMHSVVVRKQGKIVYEQYFNGYGADSLHDSRSAFKSITSLLVGIAVDKGLIRDINQPVYTFFPENKAFATDPLKRQMTIKNLLEMRAGFDCEEWDDGKDCESEMQQKKNWVQFSLDLPMKNKPGTVWAYTSCAPMVLSGVIQKVSGLSVMAFATQYLFAPLGIKHYRWTVDPSGHGMTAGSFFMRPADMAKIGQLVLDDGIWNGKRIISKSWLTRSTQCDIAIPDASFMKTSRSKAGIPQPTYYGFYWYREVMKTPSGSYPVILASGNGGQYIMIVKSLGIVAAFTQGNYGSWTAKQAFDILAKYILTPKAG